jgi:hypothetical protein
VQAKDRAAVVAASRASSTDAPSVLGQTSPQGCTGRGRKSMRTHADHSWCAVRADLSRLEEEVDAPLRPSACSIALRQSALAAEPTPKLREECVEPLQIAQAGCSLDVSCRGRT